jgi:hypothetical protein
MGGQACVLYGAAEFSRDCDIVMASDEANLARLRLVLKDLEARLIAVPPFERAFLEKGHAVHFRCEHLETRNIRLNAMSRLLGCDEFEELWERRTTIEVEEGESLEALGIEDLVRAKKTQREEDWPMIARLVEAHYVQFRGELNPDRVRFWLRESLVPETIIAVVAEFPDEARAMKPRRDAVEEAFSASHRAIRRALDAERAAERADDERYWEPLKRELESLRRARRG